MENTEQDARPRQDIFNDCHTKFVTDLPEKYAALPALPALMVFTKSNIDFQDLKSEDKDISLDVATCIQLVKSTVKDDYNTYGIIFIVEAWMLRDDPDNLDSVKADIAKIDSGEMKLSDSEHKMESALVFCETRDGFKQLDLFEIDRSGDSPTLINHSIYENPADIVGKDVNFFVDDVEETL